MSTSIAVSWCLGASCRSEIRADSLPAAAWPWPAAEAAGRPVGSLHPGRASPSLVKPYFPASSTNLKAGSISGSKSEALGSGFVWGSGGRRRGGVQGRTSYKLHEPGGKIRLHTADLRQHQVAHGSAAAGGEEWGVGWGRHRPSAPGSDSLDGLAVVLVHAPKRQLEGGLVLADVVGQACGGGAPFQPRPARGPGQLRAVGAAPPRVTHPASWRSPGRAAGP